MTKSSKIIFESSGNRGTIYLNNPDKLNAFDAGMVNELDVALEKIKKSKIKVVILKGKGTSFCSGGNLFWEKQIGNLHRDKTKAQMGLVQEVFSKIESIPQIFISVIQGYAAGGGNELAMACDMRIGVETAKFSHPENSLGTIAPIGGTKRLPRLIGLGRAKYMLFTGNVIDSKTALEWGLIDFLVPEKQIESFLNSLVNKIINVPHKALELTKKSFNRDYLNDLNDESDLDAYVECSRSKENKERLDKFLNRKKSN